MCAIKWYQKPYAKLILRITKYTTVCLTLYLFLHEIAWFTSAEAKYSLDRTLADYLTGSIHSLLVYATIGFGLGGPAGIALGSIAAVALKLGCRGRIRPKLVRLTLAVIVLLAILPAILTLPDLISMLHGNQARIIASLMVVPLGMALRCSQLVAAKFISDAAQSEAPAQELHPRNRLILRTAAYGAVIGVPLLTAYVWLFMTVARTWYTVDGPVFVLLICLIFGAGGFALLGGIFGAIMALSARLAHGRIHDAGRLRVLVSLIPLLFVLALILPVQPDRIEAFWRKIQIGYFVQRLEAAGMILAIATSVGICQITFAKYQRETSPPKNDRPLALWRPMPLVAVVVLLVVCSVAISVSSRALYLSQIELDPASRMSESERLLRAARDGVSVGLVFGSAIALTIMLRFSRIGRPVAYRLTIFVVALLVAAAFWGDNTIYALSRIVQRQDPFWLSVILLAEVIATVLAAMILSEVYRRLATLPDAKRQPDHLAPVDAASLHAPL